MATKGEMWGWGGRNRSEAWDEHTHTTMYMIINKDLPYSKGKSTQYSVITYMRKESGVE